ncbi:hypothetical protein BD779DRAFT_1467776 [Infundibulicybe gibba]|nr:hypothetical protein BD779DRAFT_1467776 [Infundibulicybe gibba]
MILAKQLFSLFLLASTAIAFQYPECSKDVDCKYQEVCCFTRMPGGNPGLTADNRPSTQNLLSLELAEYILLALQRSKQINLRVPSARSNIFEDIVENIPAAICQSSRQLAFIIYGRQWSPQWMPTFRVRCPDSALAEEAHHHLSPRPQLQYYRLSVGVRGGAALASERTSFGSDGDYPSTARRMSGKECPTCNRTIKLHFT